MKVVRPSHICEMAKEAVTAGRCNIRLVCQRSPAATLFSVSGKAQERELRDCQLADAPEAQPEDLRLWALLPVSMGCRRFPFQPKAHASHLSIAEARPTDQA